MSTDLRKLLEKAAGGRSSSVVAETLWRRGRRRRALWLTGWSLGLSVVVAVGAFIAVSPSGSQRRLPVTGQSLSPTPPVTCPGTVVEGITRFAPKTYNEGTDVVMPIAFLDGSTAEMIYPSELALEELYIQPSGNVTLKMPEGEMGGQFTVFFSGGSPGEPLETRPDGRGGTIREWKPVIISNEPSLVELRLGCWTIQMKPATRLTEDARAALAENLTGIEADSGFLSLSARDPVRVWKIGDYPGHPELYFDQHLTISAGCIGLNGLSTRQENGLLIHEYEDDFEAWCDRSTQITVGVEDPQLGNELIRSLSFRAVTLVNGP